MLPKLRELVREEIGEENWLLHVANVVKYAKHLAEVEGVDQDIAEMAALLHDIGRYKFGGKEHEITGVPEAEKILKELGASENVIEEVKHCVATHRASKDAPPKTKIAEIIRDADAMAHFDIIPTLVQVGLKKHDNDIKKAIEWVDAKLDRDWNNKMHLPESKKIVEEKYKAAKLLLKANLDCF
jgi:putative nucleotidyltransferase with HDIG domain